LITTHTCVLSSPFCSFPCCLYVYVCVRVLVCSYDYACLSVALCETLLHLAHKLTIPLLVFFLSSLSIYPCRCNSLSISLSLSLFLSLFLSCGGKGMKADATNHKSRLTSQVSRLRDVTLLTSRLVHKTFSLLSAPFHVSLSLSLSLSL